ncbi:MAG TPA: hypothetical protein VGY98_12630, partial [Verrucomicrobiae bacterium]|nr:hypothetical protein [Verrucomicrobiae bacterium]
NHICTQSGMTDTDDVAAAQMFLQRRLEMIWNAALWRNSLLEATLTINPDGTTTLADSYWIPERSVLLLPAAIEKIIAVRLNTNALEVASLESYYRTDTDWLDYQGTPFEFQILKPVVTEFVEAMPLYAVGTGGAATWRLTPDGVTEVCGSASATAQGQFMGLARALYAFTGSTTATLGLGAFINLPATFPAPNGPGAVTFSAVTPAGNVALFTVGISGAATISSEYLPPGTTSITSSFLDYYPTTAAPANTQEVDFSNYATTGAAVFDPMVAALLPASYAATQSPAALHQRIRLTEAPQVAVNLRVLGKGKCPVLGPYDSVPITNAEPALMAFARGDLLLRQRQFGKANLAQQEGAALLKELIESEAFQQAGEFKIQPDAGFGSDIFWRTEPDSYHPV